MPDSFQLEMIVAAEPLRVFSAWMDSREHAAFTGGGEAVVEPWAGGRFIAWDGYIHGILLGVDEGRRIVQTWRTSEFPPESRDSRVVVEFEPVRGGTRVVVRHSDLPPSHVKKYEKGWTPASRAPETTWGRQPEKPARRPHETSAGKGRKAAARKTVPRKSAAKSAARKERKQRKPARRPSAARRKAGSRRSRR